MTIDLKMPALSPTMEKGTLAKWLVKKGDSIRSGDLIAEIETDKATMEFEAIDEGTVAELLVAEGTDDVAVGTVIARLAEEGETVDASAERTDSLSPAPAAAAKPVPAAPIAAPTPISAPEKNSIAPAPIVIDEAIKASPLAKRIAAAEGISLAEIKGSGSNGRIIKADLGLATPAAAVMAPASPPSANTAPIYDPPADVPHEAVKLSSMRKTIARRLTESKQNVPHFYLTARCRLDALLKQRGELNEGLASRGVKLSVNDILIKALALAMTEVPDVNVQFGGEQLYRFDRADISMAVAVEGGLITPVIRDAGGLSLSAIATLSKSLAEKARAGKLVPEDYQGGTASISNLGMFGIDEMFPVINPPQALILGIGSGIEQPWRVDDEIGFATIMAATASFDHRAIDGATAAQFMAAFRDLVENPVRILV
ncbi:pyruvate dehydrogenase complex dihydrolipoamide acetyltransferase [Sphingobium phenoxybenzoativorans]|uniref:Acetyltransferase component of pyruvate dehydrogenase complex n=1 Tax=Sphingobium phenoxybenzoativorans TaxID=1592790 RepID=A0A975K9A9_9SPHN|nr:pyruvate dehydrogenase complex dihydrolipoamide acetyltransferase [Sphingobium phenoxybenzoativorans]QUT07193.1 pyruvate dehydrogenase complex dihydrolipoamide acetyltransferase [Sphingobium phenoxybenzoativorans]